MEQSRLDELLKTIGNSDLDRKPSSVIVKGRGANLTVSLGLSKKYVDSVAEDLIFATKAFAELQPHVVPRVDYSTDSTHVRRTWFDLGTRNVELYLVRGFDKRIQISRCNTESLPTIGTEHYTFGELLTAYAENLKKHVQPTSV